VNGYAEHFATDESHNEDHDMNLASLSLTVRARAPFVIIDAFEIYRHGPSSPTDTTSSQSLPQTPTISISLTLFIPFLWW
jgi:hypothetical protein